MQPIKYETSILQVTTMLKLLSIIKMLNKSMMNLRLYILHNFAKSFYPEALSRQRERNGRTAT